MPPMPLDRVAQALDQSSDQIRIKKLLICTCYGTWETRSESLNRMAMRDLLETVLMRSPTLDSLQYELNRVVKTLSKPVEYAHVANIIVRGMAWLYQKPAAPVAPPAVVEAPVPAAPPVAPGPLFGGDDEQTGWLATPAQIPPPNPYRNVLQQLKHHPQGTRLKKLAICACYNTWESDPAKLQGASWDKLLPQILDLIPQRQNLEYVMQQIVNSLSKPQTYRAIAQALTQILLPLYEDVSPPLTFRDTPPPPPLPPLPVSAVNPMEEATVMSTTPIAPRPAPPPPPAPVYGMEEATVFSTAPIAHPATSAPVYNAEEATVFSTAPIVHPATPAPAGHAAYGDAAYSDAAYGHEAYGHEAYSDAAYGHEAYGHEAYSDAAYGDFVYGDSTYLSPTHASPVYPPVDSTEVTIPDPQAYSYPAQPVPPPPVSSPAPAAGLVKTAPLYDPFELRIELMKYTNPLMAKILIYSLLYEPFDFRTSDWQQLREFDLDSLIQTLYSQYRHYAELGTCLQSMADQLPDPELTVQAAGTLLRILKPMYLQRPEAMPNHGG